MKIEELENGEWLGKIDGVKICVFEYYKDEAGDYWLSKAQTSWNYRKQGYGTLMIQAAIEAYDKVLFSKAS